MLFGRVWLILCRGAAGDADVNGQPMVYVYFDGDAKFFQAACPTRRLPLMRHEHVPKQFHLLTHGGIHVVCVWQRDGVAVSGRGMAEAETDG